ncbi:MAG: leucine-rich repeat protein [Clostridia bacterium]|nr:leucine-rich repeat protein [Clostridia bacterium]
MEKTTRRVTSVVSFVLALLTVLASCNVSLLTGAALTTQVTDLTELIVDSESVNLNSDSNSSYEEDEWITYEAPLYNSDGPVLLSDDVAGDINGDGRSTVVDSVALLQYLAGGDVACVYNAMDVNGDKQINKQDVGALIKYIVGFTKTVNVQPACAHTFADPIAVAVTCTEDGTREHWECSTCHVKFSDAQGTVAVTDRYLTVKASGHKEAVIPAVAATCVEKGATAGVKCKTCSAVLTAPQDVDPTGNHTYTDPIPEIKATVTTTGMTAGTRCSVCGNIGVNPVLVPALGTAELIYELTGDYYTVKGLAESCTADVIIIPAFYNGKPVKAIAPGAFANRTHITEVVILSYESSATIKPKGPEVELTGGVTEIGEGAFSGCTGLTDVDMGNCVENISNAAFSGCSSLENVNISENVSNIGEGSFTGCANLETVTLPGAVENIGNNAFAGCESLTSLDYQGTQEEWADLSKNNIWEENKEVKVSCYSEGLLMELSADGTYYIVAGIGECKDTELKLPAEYKGLPVTQIKECAFQDNTTITSVAIPKSITFIGKAAFADAAVLTKVSITDLAAWCAIDFESANANPLNFAKNLYLNDKLVTDLVIGNEIESIANFAFSKCNIQSVTIGNGVKRIGASAFSNCDSLTEIVIPDNVTTLDARVFSGCDNLTTAHVGTGIKLLSAFTFSNCSKLTTVTLGSNINRFGAGVFSGCTALTSVNIPAGVTSFYGECFYNCSSLASIKLPEGLQNIGDHTFDGCSALTEIVIPDSVTEIGAHAFNSCTSLTKVTIGSGVETIGGAAFGDDTVLTSVYIKDLAAWCEISFANISSNPLSANISDEIGELYVNGVLLTDLRIPEGVEKIGGYAFRGITTLKTVVIPEGVSEIGTYAFANCTALQHVELPASLQILGEYVFLSDKSVQSIIYYGSVAEWNKVQKTNWNERCPIATPSIYSIGLEFVENETGYTVTGIGSCVESKITIPEYYNNKPITAIEKNAFKGASIVSVSIPKTVTSIGTGVFSGCASLQSIIVEEGNPIYQSVGNCLIDTATKTLVAGCKNSVIPADGSVTSIGGFAFQGCTGLERVSIPACITSIVSGAFDGCKNLNRVDISDIAAWCAIEFSNITANPLYNGTDLYLNGVLVTDLVIPSTVTSISKFAFFNCTSFKTISIGANVSSIGSWVFAGCDNVESITVDAANKNYHVAGNCLIQTALKRLVSGFKTSVIPEDGSVVTINSGAFRHITSLKSIVIPASVKMLDSFAFMDCTALESVAMSGGLTTIRQDAFSNCKKLTTVIIPNTVKNIEAGAFRRCTSIATFIFDGSPSEWEAVTKKDSWNFGCTFTVTYTKEDHVHTLVHVEAKAATCTEDGNIEYWYCSSCDWMEVTGGVATDKTAVIIPATGHKIGEWTVVKEATKTENGLKIQICSVCNTEISEVIPYLGSEGLLFEINSNGTAYHLEGMGECTDTDLYIPAVYNGLPVTAIAEAATFPNTIVSLHIPASITKINYSQWGNKLTGVYITDLAAWCNIAFSKTTCNPLRQAGNLYLNGQLVTELILPEGLETIKYASFAGCESITSVVIPDSVKKIRLYAFERCTGLTSVNIPANVTSIENGVFRYCSNIETMTVDPENSVYHSVNNCIINTNKKILVSGCKNSVLPTDGSITTISTCAFEGCSDLIGIVIPNGVTTIDYAAFWQCKGLTSVVIPNSVTTIGESAFYMCTSLESINIPNSVTVIGEKALERCYALQSITVEAGNTVYHSAGNCLIETATKTLIAGCNNSVIPADGSVTSIVDYAFYGCKGLKTIVIPEGVTSIGNYVFYNCSALTNVVMPNGVTSIGNYAFRYCSALTSVTIPASVTSIGNYAFANCTALTTIIFDGNEAQWQNVTKGKSWNMSSKFTVICMVAEDGHTHDQTKVEGKAPTCTESGLTEGVKCSVCGKVFTEQVVIPAIGHAAGEWTVTKEPTKAEEGMKKTSCTTCGLEFTSYIQPIASEGLVYTLNDDGKSYTLSGIGTCTDANVVIAGEYEGLPVTTIGESVFDDYTLLESLYIPSSIIRISGNNYSNSKNFKKLLISDLAAWCSVSCLTIGTPLSAAGTLYLNGKPIDQIVVPDGVTTINLAAFSGSNIISVTIPETVKVINNYAFYNCRKLKEVYIAGGVEKINYNAFSRCSSIISFVYDGSSEQWEAVSKGNDWNYNSDFTVKFMVAADGHIHNLVKIDAVAPSCTTTGLTEGLKCSVCEEVFKLQEKVTALGHKPGEWKVVTEPTNTVAGSKSTLCTVCNAEIVESVPALGSEGLAYELNADGTEYTLTGIGTCTDTNIVIATTINNIPVTAIKANAFANNKTITSVVISNKITSVGEKVFYGCSKLQSVTLSTGLKTVGKAMFRNCTSLNKIYFPTTVTAIGDYAFANTGLITAKLPSGMKTIGSFAFRGCKSLKTVYFGSKITSIGSDAFEGCTSLTNVTLPSSLVSIGSYAFSDCDSMTEITIPAKVTKINIGAFSDCDMLEAIKVNANNTTYAVVDNCLIMLSAKALVAAVNGFVIPTDGSVTSIFTAAFQGLDMVEVVIPDAITTLGQNLFNNCTALTNVYFGSGVTEMGTSQFSNCPALTSVTVSPENITFKVVNNCLINVNDKSVILGYGNCVIPNDGSVTQIAERAFANNSTITEMVIPEGITTIGWAAFEQCVNLVSVSIPASVTYIDGFAFSVCEKLNSVIIPATVTNIGDYAFQNCFSITAFIFDGDEAQWNAVNKGERWNNNCTFTVQFMVAADGHRHDQTKVEGKAPTCTESGLTEGVKCSVCGKIFTEQAVIPATGHVAGEWTVTKEPTKTEEGVKTSTCKTCGYAFTSYVQPIASEGLVYTLNEDGKSYTLSGMGTCTDTDVVIAGEYEDLPVTMIAKNAFADNKNFESLYIPSNITYIGWGDFWNFKKLNKILISDLAAWCNIHCEGENPIAQAGNLYLNGKIITDLVIPDGVAKINGNAFAGTGIKSVIIPESVEYIGVYVFSNCQSLKEIRIPKNVSSIGWAAFRNSGIESIIVDSENQNFVVVNNCLINVAEKKLVFGYGNCSIPDDGSVEVIEYYALQYNSDLTEIVIPSSVKTIGYSAFSTCDNVEIVEIQNGITKIDGNAFTSCYRLKRVVVPNSVTSIGEYAFTGCGNINTFIFNGIRAEWEAVTKGKDWNSGCNFEVKCSDDVHSHSLVQVLAVAPTCTNPGNMEYWKCSSCDWLELEGGIATNMLAVILPAAHTPGEWVIDKEATQTEEGSKYQICSVCGERLTIEVIPYTGSEGLEYTLAIDEDYYTVTGIGTCLDTEIVIPAIYKGKPVTGIGCNVFAGCTRITSVSFPDCLGAIDMSAFSNCNAIKSIFIPKSVIYIGWNTFSGCSSLESIVVESGNEVYHSYDNCLIETATKTLVLGCKTSVIPTDGRVNTIGLYSFSGCSELQSIEIPNTIIEIGQNAFEMCTGLTSIKISENVEIIDSNAFWQCTKLETVVIPDSVTRLGYSAFGYCSSLIRVILPKCINSIEAGLFNGCTNLQNVVIPDNVTIIGNYAFVSCSSLESVSIPSQVCSIEMSAFTACTTLENFTFKGTMAQWNGIGKGEQWNLNTPFTVVHCTDGDVAVP